MNLKLFNSDNLEILKTLPDNSVDSIVTDPPYGLSFMGKKWDYDVPSIELWTECFRVLKPGGHLLSFAGSKTYHKMAVRIEDSGFEIRDQIMYVYGSGFPKSLNIAKAVNKLQKNSQWEGWGTALKPAHEPIVVARKPLSEKSVAENVLKWGTGGINIDGCRVKAKPRKTGTKTTSDEATGSGNTLVGSSKNRQVEYDEMNLGRFPANFIHDGSDEVIDLFPDTGKAKPARTAIKGGKSIHDGGWKKDVEGYWPEDTGGSASRFFYCAKASKSERNKGLEGFEEKPLAFSNQAKAELKRGNINFEGVETKGHGNKIRHLKNNHPTVKPIALMRYLCRLITPKNGLCLDPFMGSGTTGIACRTEGFGFIGIELDSDYFKIAEARINNWTTK